MHWRCSVTYAHPEDRYGNRHDLVAHPRAVAEQAARFAEPLHARELGYFLGLWHGGCGKRQG